MQEKSSKIIAIDFDGTLTKENIWPKIGEANEVMVALTKYHKVKGNKIILWTCRDGEHLEDALKWCEDRGIVFDAVNDNLPEIKNTYGGNVRKIYADVYIDDKSVNPSSIDLLEI